MSDTVKFGGPGLPAGKHTWYPYRPTEEEMDAARAVKSGRMPKAEFSKLGYRTPGAVVRVEPGDVVPVERIAGGVQGYLDRGQATLQKAPKNDPAPTGGKKS